MVKMFSINKTQNTRTEITLNNTKFTLFFSKNYQSDVWNLSIKKNDKLVVSGLNVTSGFVYGEYDLLEQYAYLGLGKLYAYDFEGDLQLKSFKFVWDL